MGIIIGSAVVFIVYMFIMIKFPNWSMEEFKEQISQMKEDLQQKEQELANLQGNFHERAITNEQLHDDILREQDKQQQLLQLKDEWKQKHQFISNQKLQEDQALYITHQVPEDEFHKDDFDIFGWTSYPSQDDFPQENQIQSALDQQLEDQLMLTRETVNNADQGIGTDMIRDETDHGMVNGMGFHLHDPQNQLDPLENLNDSYIGSIDDFHNYSIPEDSIDYLSYDDTTTMNDTFDEGMDMQDDSMDIYDSTFDDQHHY